MNRSGQPQPLRVGHRSAAGLLALLWCVAPVLSALHSAQEIHRYCAEHGVLEDAEPGATAAAAEEAAGGPAVEATSAGAPAHDHCAFAGFVRQVRLAGAPCLTAAALEGSGLDLPALPAHVPAPVALLRLAPKTSPPV